MKTIYLNLEDDVAKTTAKIKAQKSEDVLLVIPKDSYLLSDSINLRLLKKQTDMLGNKVYILTMDTTGQMYAREAGFPLKRLPRIAPSTSISDIRPVTPRRSSVHSEMPPAPAKSASIETPEKPAVVRRPGPVAAKASTRTRIITQAPVIETSKIYKTSSRAVRAGSTAQTTMAHRQPIPASPTDNVYMPPDSGRDQLPRKRSYKRWLTGFVVLALIIVVLLVTVVLPSANVTVFAKSQPVSRDLEIGINSNIVQSDNSRLVLPATNVNEAKNISDSFTVNGKKEVGSKAQGRVAIYNLTGSPLNLKANTTVLTVGSKSYYFSQDLGNITALENPNKDSNATITDIIAGDGGEEFNLPAGTRMEINNQSFGSQPQRLYAKTVTQVIGGSSRFVSVISQDDITASQQRIIKSAVDQINQNLPDGRKLVEGAYTVALENYMSDKPEGTETTAFVASATVKITGLAFNETGLREMVRSRLQQSLGSDKILQDIQADSVVNKIKSSDFAAGNMILSVHYESQALPVLDEQSLIGQIAGKSKDEASDVLLTNPDIEKIDLTLAPSWQRSLPRLAGKIHLEIVK